MTKEHVFDMVGDFFGSNLVFLDSACLILIVQMYRGREVVESQPIVASINISY